MNLNLVKFSSRCIKLLNIFMMNNEKKTYFQITQKQQIKSQFKLSAFTHQGMERRKKLHAPSFENK